MALIVNALRIAAVLSGAFLPQGAQHINAKCLLSTMYDPVMRAANFGFSGLEGDSGSLRPFPPSSHKTTKRQKGKSSFPGRNRKDPKKDARSQPGILLKLPDAAVAKAAQTTITAQAEKRRIKTGA